MKLDNPAPADWLAMPIQSWAKKVGISRSHAYALIKSGKLKILKSGKRTLITKPESDRFLATGA